MLPMFATFVQILMQIKLDQRWYCLLKMRGILQRSWAIRRSFSFETYGLDLSRKAYARG
jgi:hypothetical protein